jgi:hypothetical protein
VGKGLRLHRRIVEIPSSNSGRLLTPGGPLTYQLHAACNALVLIRRRSFCHDFFTRWARWNLIGALQITSGLISATRDRRFKSGPLIRNSKNHILRIQHPKPYFTQWGSDPNCYMILSRYLHQLCAHVFRVDVFTHMRKNLAEEYKEDALAGKIPLCYEAVKAALDPDSQSGGKTDCAKPNVWK